MCKENGCKIIQVFNNKGETNGLYCSQHKKKDTRNLQIKKMK